MINALSGAAPAALEAHQATAVSRGRLPSTALQCAGQRQCDGPAAIANLARTKRMRGVQGRRASQRGNLNRHNANHRTIGQVGIAADQVAPNLAALADGPILRLRSTTRLVPLGRAIGVGGDNNVGHRLGGFAGDQVHKNVHQSSPRFGHQYIGPMALHVNGENA